MFQHQDPVAACDRNSAARAAFTKYDGDARYPKQERCVGRSSDCFRLAALFRVDTWKRARGINKRNDRQAESVGKLHDPRRLAIAFRPRHAKIMLYARLCVRTF